MTHRLVETLTRFTPLGIRFWDPSSARPVREGLRVRAWPEGAAGSGRQAFRTVSGVYAFSGLPGLEAVEWGEAPSSGPEVVPLQRRFVVAVEDPRGRFLPAAFVLDLPREERGPYPAVEAGSLPEDSVPGVPLFSAPARPVPPGAAAVRAELRDAATGEPAAHALLEVEVDGESWLGLADGGGRVAVYFPVPTFRHVLVGSFPEGGAPPHEHTWELTIRVRWASGAVSVAPEGGFPLLATVSDQPPGLLHGEAPGSLVPGEAVDALSETLVHGRETVVRSRGSSFLLVSSAPSLP